MTSNDNVSTKKLSGVLTGLKVPQELPAASSDASSSWVLTGLKVSQKLPVERNNGIGSKPG